jgi:hypothetical protein
MSEKNWTNVFLLLAVIFFAVFGYFLWNDKNGQTSALIATGLCIIASRSGVLKKLKLSPTGVEAELQSLVDDAKATIEQLHSLAINQSKLVLQLLQAEGRWGGGSRDDKERMRAETLSMLQELGVADEAIEELKAVEHPYMHFDYCGAVTRDIHQDLTAAQRQNWNEFFSHDIRKGIGFEPEPDELEKFLTDNKLLNADVAERLLDYREFHEHGTHRRESRFVLGSNDGQARRVQIPKKR